jgi:hypothetical protein
LSDVVEEGVDEWEEEKSNKPPLLGCGNGEDNMQRAEL